MFSLTSFDGPAYTIVFNIAAALSGLGGAATAIAVCTLAVRLLLLPLTVRAVRAQRGGALFGLLQAPVFFVLYRLFYAPRIAGHPNALLSQALFGVRLGARFPAGGGSHLLVFGVLFAALGLLGWWFSRWSRRVARATGTPAGWLVRLAPYATVAVAAYVPLAAGIYLVTTRAVSAVETVVLRTGLPPAAS